MTDLLKVLVEMRAGQVAADCNQKFSELLKAVLDTGQKGQMTLVLNLEPAKMGMGGVVLEVSAEHSIKLKKPELAIGEAVFFVTKQGDLTRDDPDQVAMFEQEIQKEQNGKRN